MKTSQYFYHTNNSQSNRVLNYTATSDFNTIALDLSNHFGSWVAQISRSATDGSPTVTVQCSNDGTNWDDYKELAINIDVSNGESIIDDEFFPRYMRLVYVANSATGTITMQLTLIKND